MKKSAILPVVSVICLAIAAITGHKVSENTVNEIAEITAIVCTAGISVWGIYKDHQKKGEGK